MSGQPEQLAATSFDRAYRTKRIARADEIDQLGHVNNAVYVRWIQDIAVEHWNALAPPEIARKFVWICYRHEIDYRIPLVDGDPVDVRTWVGKPSGAKFDRHVDIRKAGAKKWSVQAKTTWVMLDADTRRPQRIGADILDYFGR